MTLLSIKIWKEDTLISETNHIKKVLFYSHRCGSETVMKNVNKKNTKYLYLDTKTRKEYQDFINLVMKNTDKVCFTVRPFLDNIEEFNNSIWSFLSENVICTTIDRPITGDFDEVDHLIVLKKDYFLYEFFLNKKNIFDFQQADKKSGITLEDPVFIKDGKVVCYTITHEKYCCIEEDLYLQLVK